MRHSVSGKVIRLVIPIDYAEIFLRRRSMLASPATPLPSKTIEDGSGVTAPRKFAARIASAAVILQSLKPSKWQETRAHD